MFGSAFVQIEMNKCQVPTFTQGRNTMKLLSFVKYANPHKIFMDKQELRMLKNGDVHASLMIAEWQ